MNRLIGIVAFLAAACAAQQSSINIEAYKHSRTHTFTERSYTVGAHTYRIVNIRPTGHSDTNCISALVLDKRKYVLFDVEVASGAFGLIVPAVQPIAGALVVLRASPYDGKLFLILSSGKVVTLPGANVLADTVGSCVYCVWDNDKTYRLTVFDYKNLTLRFTTTPIAPPSQWFTDGFSYGFTSTDGSYYTVDFLQKAITKIAKPAVGLTPVSYVADLGAIDRTQCCGPDVMTK